MDVDGKCPRIRGQAKPSYEADTASNAPKRAEAEKEVRHGIRGA